MTDRPLCEVLGDSPRIALLDELLVMLEDRPDVARSNLTDRVPLNRHQVGDHIGALDHHGIIHETRTVNGTAMYDMDPRTRRILTELRDRGIREEPADG